MAAEKQEVRQRVIAARAGQVLAADRAALIAEAGLALLADLVRPGVKVAAFSSFGHEPPTADLIVALQATGCVVLLPRAADDGSLSWHPVTGSWLTDRYGIPTPDSPRDAEGLQGCAAVFVPALAASADGRRLGRGAGYYDRELAGLPAGRPVRIGLVEPAGLLPEGVIPMAEHDQWLDFVIAG